MQDPLLVVQAVRAVVASALGIGPPRHEPPHHGPPSQDRGAVSIEQVLWYAAAAVSVAVVAAIIWSQIRTTASTPVQSPSAP